MMQTIMSPNGTEHNAFMARHPDWQPRSRRWGPRLSRTARRFVNLGDQRRPTFVFPESPSETRAFDPSPD